MTTNTADMDRYDEWDDDYGDVWGEEPLDPEDPRSYLVPLLWELLGGGGPAEELPPLEEVVREGIASPYFQRLLRLVELLGQGVELEGLVLPSDEDARRIGQALGLTGGRAAPELSMLWVDALLSRMITSGEGRATPLVTPTSLATMDVSEQLRVVRSVGVMRMSHVVETTPAYSALLHLLIESGRSGRAWAPIAGSLAFGVDREYGRSADDAYRAEAAADLDEALDDLVELAVVERDGERARLTAYGDVVLERWTQKQIELL